MDRSTPSKYNLTPSEIKTLEARSTYSAYLLKHRSSLEELTLLDSASSSDTTLKDQEMVVCIRARPLLQHELSRGLFGDITTDPLHRTAHLHTIEQSLQGTPLVKSRAFTVDAAFDASVSSETVYATVARDLVPLALDGGVASLFAYGQTGSGKTFTVTAIERLLAQDLFAMAEEVGGRYRTPGHSGPVYEFEAAFFELLGNKARDLLNPDAPHPVTILEDVFGRVQVTHATTVPVSTPAQLLALIEAGAALRRTEATDKNATSSRSHAVLRIRVRNLCVPEAEDGLIHLLDLAGSEGAADTRGHDRERVKESVEINKSLATLKECIRNRALAAAGGKHVQNSKLTVLLKEAFELSSARLCKTVVIAALSPSVLDAPQSLSTLRYVGPLKVSLPSTGPPAHDPSNPSTWTNADLRAWVVAVAPPNVNVDTLCPTESGKQAIRMGEAEFLRRCMVTGCGEKAAKKFYLKLWKLVVDARTRTRDAKMKELSKRVNNASKERGVWYDKKMAAKSAKDV
ncbi:hypothetical protein HDU96_003159 [Phlyctochytrium bullatum]|nr:hypothetical protein HDU96_003159 [Phlyctochytrium bullatum]